MTYHQILISPELGGGCRKALNIGKYLKDQKKSVRIWLPGQGGAAEEAIRLGLDTEYYDKKTLFDPGFLRSLCPSLNLALRLRKQGSGLIHFHQPYLYGALRRIIPFAGLKRVVHIDLEADVQGLDWAFRPAPDMVVTCANYLVNCIKDELEGKLNSLPPIVALPNAIDTTIFCSSH